MKQCLNFHQVLNKLIVGKEELFIAEIIQSAGILLYILSALVWSIFKLKIKKRRKLMKSKNIELFGKLYVGLDVQSKYGLYYFFSVMLRFVLIVLITDIFWFHSTFQIQSLMLLNTAYPIWYFWNLPHLYRSRRNHEMTHECFCMLASYHLVVFSDAFRREQ